MAFLLQNGGTIIVGLILLAVVALILRSMVKRARQGQCVSCDGCNKACACHGCSHGIDRE